jgi:hypothetical protein
LKCNTWKTYIQRARLREKIPLSTSDYQRLPKSDKVLDFSQANRRFVPDKVIAF